MRESTNFTRSVALIYETESGGSLQAVLSNKSVVTLSPEGDGTITWTSSNGSIVLKAPLRRGD